MTLSILHPGHRPSHSWILSASLVRCLRAVADTYHPSILETTFPEALFSSLVQLLRIKEPSKSPFQCIQRLYSILPY